MASNWTPFKESAITDGARKVCDEMRANDEATKDLFDDVEKLRAITPGPTLPCEYFDVQSRDPERMINCCIVRPSNGELTQGIYLHFHGGGLSIGTHDMNIAYLQRLADASGCTAISVGYRLGPEFPFPAPLQDCFDVADYIIDSCPTSLGGRLHFIGGELAGGYLTMQVYLHIAGTRPQCDTIKGLLLSYGLYSWSYLPSVYTLRDPVCLDLYKMDKFRERAFGMVEWSRLPSICEAFDPEFGTLAHKGPVHDHPLKHPVASPLYRSIDRIAAHMPPALFLCGTADPLYEDTILMSARWQIAGGDAVVEYVPGAPHAFVEVPIETSDCCAGGHDIIRRFILSVK
ncbi:uncharacterized protein DNG_09912 [Cephalotrichum gorgonifer]|uniref:Alpha/beta hydrolase fold-3 domain-containing protein n=1 Tax=Cephalotrichum gorgonifer TaxID=2041049 RepID=A0AAE8N898_9PEZI|nr:uncharacterized protein DNG_09912 [Cephalotrichum gorgonifer]